MVHAKNYEIISTFVKVMQKNSGLFFSGHSVYPILRYGSELAAARYLKTFVIRALSSSVYTVDRISPEMDHRRALRSAIKGPPAG